MGNCGVYVSARASIHLVCIERRRRDTRGIEREVIASNLKLIGGFESYPKRCGYKKFKGVCVYGSTFLCGLHHFIVSQP